MKIIWRPIFIQAILEAKLKHLIGKPNLKSKDFVMNRNLKYTAKQKI